MARCAEPISLVLPVAEMNPHEGHGVENCSDHPAAPERPEVSSGGTWTLKLSARAGM